MSSLVGKQALVIGAGMAGLTAARVLCNHFERVVVLDRDDLPSDATHRAGTPQSRHVHAILSGGLRALDEVFQGFSLHLAQAGAVETDFPLDMRIERGGYDPFPRRKFDIITYCASRPLMEFTTRQLVAQQPNVEFRQGCRVREIMASPNGAIVTGVCCETASGQTETIAADLVIDASGRGTLTLDLLKSSGHPVPEETSIGMDIGYSTGIFEIPDDFEGNWKGLATAPHAPQTSRGAVMLPREGNQWTLTLYGMHGDKPPGDWAGFLAYANSLRTPTVYNAVSTARRIGEIHRFVLPASVLRHFERLSDFPRGLIPLGDAICRFNPVFGQGMSVAAIEAASLNRLLSTRAAQRQPLAGLAEAYFDVVQDLIKTPWSAARLDLIYPETSGSRPADLQETLKFGAGVFTLAARDPQVHKLFSEVQQLLKPNSVYRDPAFVERVQAIMAEA
jgi:2-polyprenyl-6-methoxyphenol hydroxylase-like FAD-dependent oxidoreductase